ncbi:MAG: hypothetical protein IPN36_16655 [Bacteroidetes bacterium]|nr:hypothetical protein [Bacteroidota bacterium]
MINSTVKTLASTLTKTFLSGSLLLLLLLPACKKKKQESTLSEKVIARVYDRYLYIEDLSNIVPQGTGKNDSLTIIKNYVQNWIRQQSILKRAEENLDEERKNVERELEEYRNSLITYIYESELVRQKLDTNISEQEIEKYYTDNEKNFQLKNNILQVRYLKVPPSAPKLEKVKQWYKSDAEKDFKLLEDYCFQFATDYFFNDEEWLLFDELLKKIPIKTYDQEQFLRNNRFIEIPDSTGVFFVNIKGFKIKESLSPLSFERENIKNLILNKRKLELISEMEKDAYQDALQKEEIENWISKP